MKKLNKNQVAFVTSAREYFKVAPNESLNVSRKELNEFVAASGLKNPSWLKKDEYRISHGVYSIPTIENEVPDLLENTVEEPVAVAAFHAPLKEGHAIVEDDVETYVPSVNPLYVKTGNFADINKIVKSNRFHPVFITGLSGNGKTMGVEQACAANKREYIPVSITEETDESDLIGDLTLENGNIKWVDGPVVIAMKRGAVLLLDEVDLASNKIMALQSILDGKGVYLKKIKKHVTPAKGFQIFATANTKGKGSEDGRFMGTNIMNEAFLERFKITLEQEYPTPATEKKILSKVFEDLGVEDDQFIDKLTTWADIIRKSYKEGAIDEIITTRRLVHIAETYSIFEDRLDAIVKCTNRFDDSVKESFLELYSNLDETLRENEDTVEEVFEGSNDTNGNYSELEDDLPF